MGERFTKKEAKTGNTRMLTVDETNDQETNDQGPDRPARGPPRENGNL